MTAGMANRQYVLDTIEDEGLEALTEADTNEAIGLLNTGKPRADVLDWLLARNAELEG